MPCRKLQHFQMNSIRNVTQREKKLRHNLLLCLMPIAQFNHATGNRLWGDDLPNYFETG